MTAITGATPLAAIDAVVFDTETTGLDTTKARIIEIGAVHVDRGRLSTTTFSQLVNPGVPIPPPSTAIHHIDDAMVKDAASFPGALAAFTVFSRGRILVGHSVGFDFAVLAREAERAGLTYAKPRSLCIRMLGQVANPNLPDHSLDMLASWLGVEIADRHRALGDSLATARIFLALIPALAERGVRTLAEAERASVALTRELERHARAGWAAPVERPGAAGVIGRIDPYAYRHRVRDVMASPPAIVDPATTLKAAIDEMAARKISSLFVAEGGAASRPVGDYGIVTERDMMRRIAEKGADAFSLRVGDMASRPLQSVRGNAFVYRAVARMDRLKVRHLAVRTEAGALEGIVSARDLLKLRAGAAISLDDAIEVSATPAEMGRAFALVPEMAGALIAEGLEAPVVAEIISEEIRAMTRRAAVLAEESMAADGLGPAPCPWALLVLGSGGRGESLLAPDQDNAIVFERGDPDGAEDRWFAEAGKRIADTLDAAGVPYCQGGVMARNPQWRGSLDTWRERIAHWVSRSKPDDLLQVDIFYDMHPVHGDLDLGFRLFSEAYEMGGASTTFAKLLGAEAETVSNPFTFLGGIRTNERGRVDLKLHGLFPIVAMARALAIRHRVEERSTRRRIDALGKLEIGGGGDFAKLLSAHSTLLATMLRQQRRDIAEGLKPGNMVETAALKSDETAALKAALSAIQATPQLVRDLMFAKR